MEEKRVYDSRGFDKNGNYENGTRFDEHGYDINGFNKDGKVESSIEQKKFLEYIDGNVEALKMLSVDRLRKFFY